MDFFGKTGGEAYQICVMDNRGMGARNPREGALICFLFRISCSSHLFQTISDRVAVFAPIRCAGKSDVAVGLYTCVF